MIRVLILDGSALVRKLMANILSNDSAIEVVGTAMNAAIARRKIELLQPDVVTLDVEMVAADGIAFLQDLMLSKPLPVVVVSSMEQDRAEVTLQALSLGAVDFVAKPCDQLRGELMNQAEEIVRKVKAAARANLDRDPF